MRWTEGEKLRGGPPGSASSKNELRWMSRGKMLGKMLRKGRLRRFRDYISVAIRCFVCSMKFRLLA